MVLIYFILLFFLLYRSKSIALIFIILQVISLGGTFLIDRNYPIVSFFSFFNALITIVLLSLIILPWRKYVNIKEIFFFNELKLKKLTKFILIISAFSFVMLLITTIFVFLYVEDIDNFKYAEGVSQDFYYSLPINIKALILSHNLYYLSYFLIPLHFYYLSKENYRLSFLCFFFSLNILLYGMTYFSRAVFVHYVFLYMVFLILLYKTLNRTIKRKIKFLIVTFGLLGSFYFLYITNQRFEDYTLYANTISKNSIIQDTIFFSYFDYLSQWYYNSMFVLDSYAFNTFNGQISLQPILSLLNQFNIINYSYDNYMNLRQKLWPEHWYSFNGYVAYIIYDFGYIISIVFSVLYYIKIQKLRPKNGQISLMSLFLIVLLIQLPLFAIFYSQIGGIVFPFLFYIPIYYYLKVKIIYR